MGHAKITSIALLTCGLLISSAAHAQTVLRFSNWLPSSEPLVGDVFEVWAKNVEKVTEGRVTVNIMPPLGKPEAHFDLVKNGIADVAMGVDGYTADRFKLTTAVKLPFLAEDSTTASIAYWRLYESKLAAYKEFAGVHVLGLWVHGPGAIFTTKRTINSIDDLKGLRLRVSGGIVQDVANRLGVVPHFAPGSQSYELLSSGVVDGILFPASAIMGFKIDRVLHNALLVDGGLYRDSHFLIMNSAKFASLSPQDRAAIDKISGEALAKLAGQSWDNGDRVALQAMRNHGYTFTKPDPKFMKELTDRVEVMTNKWKENMKAVGVDGNSIINAFRDEIAKVKAELAK